MYPPTANLYKNFGLTTISANQPYAPVFECIPSSSTLDINTSTFPTPKEDDYYIFEGSPHSSNNGQMTPLSPCSITDQQNFTFVYNNNPIEMPPDSLALSNPKMPLVTHHASNIKSDNKRVVSNLVPNTNEVIQPISTADCQSEKNASQNLITEEENGTDSNKQNGAFTPTNFKHMSREQLIARLLFLENEKSNSNYSKSQQSTPTHCRWKDCNKNFDTLKKLISHLTEVHVGGGKASYQCEWEECPRKNHPFTKRHKMHNHLRTHTGERPFMCTKPDCKKKFSRLDSLTTHLKTHSNIRPYVCLAAGCGKAYYHSRSLKKHEKIHESSTPSSSPLSNQKQETFASVMTVQSPQTMIPQQQQQPFIPYGQFMYDEKVSLVDTSNYNRFILNTENTSQ